MRTSERQKASGFMSLLAKKSGNAAVPCNVIEGSDIEVLGRIQYDVPLIEVRVLSGGCKGKTGLLNPERMAVVDDQAIR